MFAASFPLAPFMALVFNIVDLRLDAKRLLWWNRRPIAFIASDIGRLFTVLTIAIFKDYTTIVFATGMWLHILRFVSIIGVVSNAFIIAYTSDFCNDYSLPHQCTDSRRLWMALLFEVELLALSLLLERLHFMYKLQHIGLTSMYLLAICVPDAPASVKAAQRRRRYQAALIMERQPG